MGKITLSLSLIHILKIKELTDNSIHIFEYKEDNGSLVAVVKSYSVLDYIRAILENEPYNYTLSENTLNAIHYGAPQRRERFIIVGLKKELNKKYIAPKIRFTEGNYRTVHDAIADIQDVTPTTEVTGDYIELESHPNATGLEKELRGRALYNHIVTATKETAMERFKALKAGENFHDLDPKLKTTYSNAERTQNTIYMRLKYNEPSGTVVNVRKSMWIHPESVSYTHLCAPQAPISGLETAESAPDIPHPARRQEGWRPGCFACA